MDRNTSKRNKRLALIFSGITDAVIGAILLLIGFGFSPIDVTHYEFQQWHAILLGGLMFTLGAGVAIYQFSRPGGMMLDSWQTFIFRKSDAY